MIPMYFGPELLRNTQLVIASLTAGFFLLSAFYFLISYLGYSSEIKDEIATEWIEESEGLLDIQALRKNTITWVRNSICLAVLLFLLGWYMIIPVFTAMFIYTLGCESPRRRKD